MRADWTAHESRGRRRVHRPCAGDPRRARGGGARGPRAAIRRAAAAMGRRHDRLSPAADRRAELHPQPRGSRQGAGGGHPLRRAADAGRGRCSTSSAAARALRLSSTPKSTATRARHRSTWSCRRARSWSPPAPSPTPCSAREDAAACRARRQVFPGARRERPARSRPSASPSRRAAHVLMSAAPRRPRHQLLRRPASVLRRQRRQGDGRAPSRAIRWSAAMLARQPPSSVSRRRADRAARRRAARHACTRSTG